MSVVFRITFILFVTCLSHFAYSMGFESLKKAGSEAYADKKFNQAIFFYESALKFAESDQERAIVLSNIGQCHRLNKQDAVALEMFERALVFAPTHRKALYWSVKLRFADYKFVLDQTLISHRLEMAVKTYPDDKNFRVLWAEFEMRRNSEWVAPGVSYHPEFLTETEFLELRALFSGA